MLRITQSKNTFRFKVGFCLFRHFITTSTNSSGLDSSNSILKSFSAIMKSQRKDTDINKEIKPNHIYKNAFNIQKNQNGYSQQRAGFKRQQQSKKIIVKWKTGSERAKAAVNANLSELLKINVSGSIKVIDPETENLVLTTIYKFADGVDLDKSGFVIVNVEQSEDGQSIPLVKMVDIRVVLKKYSENMAKMKERELSEMGVSLRRPSKRNDVDKADEDIKHIKLSWKITEDDLSRQKSHEIQTSLKKGFKVYIYVDDRVSRNNSRTWISDFLTDQDQTEVRLPNKERKQREVIYDKLQEIVEKYSITPVIEGSINSRMLIKLTPKLEQKKKPQNPDKRSLIEQRKRERQEKLQKRTEKKRYEQAQ